MPVSEMEASRVRTASKSLAEGKCAWDLLAPLVEISLSRSWERGGDECTILTIEAIVSTATAHSGSAALLGSLRARRTISGALLERPLPQRVRTVAVRRDLSLEEDGLASAEPYVH